MWNITTSGFTSAVQDKDDPAMLVIRARALGDLERLIKPLCGTHRPRIIDNEGTDYPYRVRLDRETYAALVYEQIVTIDYGNFKDAVKARQGKHRAGVYGSIWSVLLRLERHSGRRHRSAPSLFESTEPSTPSAEELERWFGRGDGAQ